KSEAEMPVDLTAWSGAVRATDLIDGGAETWRGTARVKLPAETGRVFRVERASAKSGVTGANASGSSAGTSRHRGRRPAQHGPRRKGERHGQVDRRDQGSREAMIKSA